MNIKQPSLFSNFDNSSFIKENVHSSFSHNNECKDSERLQLENRYAPLFVSDARFDRKIVSFQANKNELVHKWLKYREGFSSALVETLLKDFELKKGDTVLDPFAGSATTLLVAKTKGINSLGIDILPNCHLAWEAKAKFADYDIEELRKVLELLIQTEPGKTTRSFPHIVITDSAFPIQTENDLMWYSDWFENMPISDKTKVLCKLMITSILEDVSYTRKDGQYLRWDYRSEKLKSRNDIRIAQGKNIIAGIDKGELPGVREKLINTFSTLLKDIQFLQDHFEKNGSKHEFIQGSTLEYLPTLPDNSINAVITSPPYANRYDYTRTYALELVYLGYGDQITSLRQELLSCTVESKSKIERLGEFYESIGQVDRYHNILNVIHNNQALNEINHALQYRWDNGNMNNKGVLPMVNQYFSELAFVFSEIFRACKTGSYVAFVNDNVRYGGEIIPVDTLTTNLAEEVGFKPEKIIVLAQKKGNSSQQMERFGRVELRKCITIWKK